MRWPALVKKEVLEILRQRELLFLILAVPFIEVIVLGYAVDRDIRNLPVEVVDLTGSRAGRRIVEEIGRIPSLRVVRAGRRPESALNILKSGRAKAVVTVRDAPAGPLHIYGMPEIQILLDGTDALASLVAGGALQTVAARSAVPRGAVEAFFPLVSVKTQVRFNPGLKRIYSFGPGFVGLLLTFLTFFLASLSLVREKERQTLDTLKASALTPLEICVGKGLPAMLVGVFHLAVGLPILLFWFGIPFRGGAGGLLLAALFYLAGITALALAISALSSSHRHAMFLAWYIIMTFLLLSGFFTPVESIPPEAWLSRAIAAVNPFRYLMAVVRGVMIKGSSWSDIQGDLFRLAGLCLTLMAGSYALLRRSLKR